MLFCNIFLKMVKNFFHLNSRWFSVFSQLAFKSWLGSLLSIKHGSLVVNITGGSMIYFFKSTTQWSNYLPQRANVAQWSNYLPQGCFDSTIARFSFASTGKRNSMVELFTSTGKSFDSTIKFWSTINLTRIIYLAGRRFWLNHCSLLFRPHAKM